MQTTSELYRSIIGGEHWFERRAVVTGIATYDEDVLVSIESNIEMFDNAPAVGTAVSGVYELQMIYPSEMIPRMAEVRLFVRACNATSKSEWIPQGVFYIDTRSRSISDRGESLLSITGYDAMLKAEQMFESETITGDSTDVDMVDEIASIMGVDVDARTYDIMTHGYTVPLPTGYTCREVLGHIASMYVGCFIMTDEGKLRLVSILEIPPATNYLIDEDGDAITFGGDRILV